MLHTKNMLNNKYQCSRPGGSYKKIYDMFFYCKTCDPPGEAIFGRRGRIEQTCVFRQEFHLENQF